jgi:hypothetical protein
MARKRKPPTEPRPAGMNLTAERGYWRVNCWRCGYQLPHVLIMRGISRTSESDASESIQVAEHDWGGAWGWVLDGATVRPTNAHLTWRSRAREIFHEGGSREVKTRWKLAGRAALSSPFRDISPRSSAVLGKTGIECMQCPECKAENLLASHRNAE